MFIDSNYLQVVSFVFVQRLAIIILGALIMGDALARLREALDLPLSVVLESTLHNLMGIPHGM